MKKGDRSPELKEKTKEIGAEYAKLETFVNTNYEAVHKIAKK